MAKQKEKEKISKDKQLLSIEQLILSRDKGKYETASECMAKCRYKVKHNEEKKSMREILQESIREVYTSKL